MLPLTQLHGDFSKGPLFSLRSHWHAWLNMCCCQFKHHCPSISSVPSWKHLQKVCWKGPCWDVEWSKYIKINLMIFINKPLMNIYNLDKRNRLDCLKNNINNGWLTTFPSQSGCSLCSVVIAQVEFRCWMKGEDIFSRHRKYLFSGCRKYVYMSMIGSDLVRAGPKINVLRSWNQERSRLHQKNHQQNTVNPDSTKKRTKKEIQKTLRSVNAECSVFIRAWLVHRPPDWPRQENNTYPSKAVPLAFYNLNTLTVDSVQMTKYPV